MGAWVETTVNKPEDRPGMVASFMGAWVGLKRFNRYIYVFNGSRIPLGYVG